MKRFHVHLHVDDLDKNIGFHSSLCKQPPTRTEADYAKWMLNDPQCIAWEHFHTPGTIAVFREKADESSALACCAPSSTAPTSATRCC